MIKITVHFGGLPFFSLKEGPARLEALLSTGWRIFFPEENHGGSAEVSLSFGMFLIELLLALSRLVEIFMSPSWQV